MDILLNVDTHDVVFDNSTVTVTSDKKQDVAQRLKIMLQTFKGEWFLNTENGIPYFDQVFGKTRNKGVLDALFQSAILSDSEVSKIESYSSSISRDRVYSATFVVLINTGETITVSVGG